MSNNPTPKFKRVLLKLSGEALKSQEEPIQRDALTHLLNEVRALLGMGVQIAIVIGGGNWSRGRHLVHDGLNQHHADQMGILFTIVNGIALKDFMQQANIDVSLFSSWAIAGVVNSYDRDTALAALEAGKVVILAGGTGESLVTTDSAASLRAIQLNADIILKASTVDGVYDSDPKTNLNAKKFDTLDYRTAIEKRLHVMDMAAFCLCEEHAMPIAVFNFMQKNSLTDIVCGKKIGTLVGVKS